jgi:hypothetical protein
MRDVDTNYSTLLAFVWMDRDRRYFVSSASSLDAGKPYVRYRWRQIDQSPDADPERLEIIIPQPKAAELYYSACGMINRHNHSCQDTLMLERNVTVHYLAACPTDSFHIVRKMQVRANPMDATFTCHVWSLCRPYCANPAYLGFPVVMYLLVTCLVDIIH